MNGLGSEMKNADEAEAEIATAAANEEVAAENAASKAGVRTHAGMLLRRLAETMLPHPDVKNLAGKNLGEKICDVAMSVHRHPGAMIVPLVGKSRGEKPLAEKNHA